MRSRRGYIFLQALIAVTALVALMAMLLANQRASMQSVQNRLRQRRAEAAVDAALSRALASVADANTNVASQSDSWYTLGNQGDDEYSLGTDATFRVQLVDAGSLIDVNTASSTQLLNLPLDQEQVDCLLDWRSTGTTARSDGAKDDYYNALQTPYNTKLAALTTLDELLLVKNWTAQTLYQSPTLTSTVMPPADTAGNTLPLASLLTVDSGAPNTQASGTARVNFSQRGLSLASLRRIGITGPAAAQIVARQPYSSFAALFAIPGLDTGARTALLNAAGFTTATRITGKIDLNTASPTVLSTVPSLSTDMASAITQQQSQGFRTLGQLATLPGMTPFQLNQIADDFTVGADTWLVRIYGASGDLGIAYEGVVGVRGGQAQTISWNRLNTTGIPAWWDWNAQAGTTLDAGTAQ